MNLKSQIENLLTMNEYFPVIMNEALVTALSIVRGEDQTSLRSGSDRALTVEYVARYNRLIVNVMITNTNDYSYARVTMTFGVDKPVTVKCGSPQRMFSFGIAGSFTGDDKFFIYSDDIDIIKDNLDFFDDIIFRAGMKTRGDALDDYYKERIKNNKDAIEKIYGGDK